MANSVVVHATADRPDGVYTRQEVVFGHFSHEPSAARAPTGEFVLFFTHNVDMNATNPTIRCKDGSSSAAAGNTNGNCNWGRDPKLPLEENCTMRTYMSWATSAAGPWATPVPIPAIQTSDGSFGSSPYADTNFAAIIEEDGSLLAWTRDGIVRARDWRNVSGYRFTGKPFAEKFFDKTWGEDVRRLPALRGLLALTRWLVRWSDSRFCGGTSVAVATTSSLTAPTRATIQPRTCCARAPAPSASRAPPTAGASPGHRVTAGGTSSRRPATRGRGPPHRCRARRTEAVRSGGWACPSQTDGSALSGGGSGLTW